MSMLCNHSQVKAQIDPAVNCMNLCYLRDSRPAFPIQCLVSRFAGFCAFTETHHRSWNQCTVSRNDITTAKHSYCPAKSRERGHPYLLCHAFCKKRGFPLWEEIVSDILRKQPKENNLTKAKHLRLTALKSITVSALIAPIVIKWNLKALNNGR